MCAKQPLSFGLLILMHMNICWCWTDCFRLFLTKPYYQKEFIDARIVLVVWGNTSTGDWIASKVFGLWGFILFICLFIAWYFFWDSLRKAPDPTAAAAVVPFWAGNCFWGKSVLCTRQISPLLQTDFLHKSSMSAATVSTITLQCSFWETFASGDIYDYSHRQLVLTPGWLDSHKQN